MKIKLLLSVFFAVVISAAALCVFSPEAAAENFTNIETLSNKQLECAQTVEAALSSYSTKIDISKYRLSSDEFKEVYFYVALDSVDLFYVNMSVCEYDYDKYGNVTAIYPMYSIKKEDYQTAKSKLDKAVNALLSGVRDEWSDVEKALYVHDYIVSGCTYYAVDDYDGKNIYEVFVDGEAVCVGYSFAYDYIMEQLGINCICVYNEEHMWNMIEIDGEWYHVDLTWDDSTPDYDGQVFHEFFMISDYAIADSNYQHETWELGMNADDCSYDGFFWHDTVSQIVYADGLWYGCNSDGIFSYSFDNGRLNTIYSFDKLWTSGKEHEITVPIARLVEHGGTIYFNSGDAVYSYNSSDRKVKKLAGIKNCSRGGYQVYDLYIEGNKLMCGIGRNYLDGIEKTAAVLTFDDIVIIPETPENFFVSRIGDYIELEWDVSENASRYMLYRLEPDSKKAVKVTTVTGNSFTLISSEDYKYAVRAAAVSGGKYVYSDFTAWTAAA